MLKRKPIDLHINHERWLVSYADFVTLLFAFFVVMYSVSQLNEAKYEELSNTLSELFSKEHVNTEFETHVSHTEALNKNKTGRVSLPELETLFLEHFSALVDSGDIQVNSNELWLQISLNNRILFSLGSVEPTEQAINIFEEIAVLLQGASNPIQVEGFTDNLPISNQQFPSNWELSSARASSIVRLLIANELAPDRLSAVGYGEHHAVADNATAAGRAQNRRVVLMIGKHPRHRPEQQAIAPTQQVVNHDSSPVPPVDTIGTPDSDPVKPITLQNGEYLFTTDPEKRQLDTQPSANTK